MSWEDDDEFGTTYGTFKNALKESFDHGRNVERDRVLDLISDRMCAHSSCVICPELDKLAIEIGNL